MSYWNSEFVPFDGVRIPAPVSMCDGIVAITGCLLAAAVVSAITAAPVLSSAAEHVLEPAALAEVPAFCRASVGCQCVARAEILCRPGGHAGGTPP